MSQRMWLMVCLFVSASLFALPVRNPIEASLLTDDVFCECSYLGFKFGYSGYFVDDHHLKTKSHGTISKTEIETNSLYLGLVACDRVELYATVGATQFFALGAFSVAGVSTATPTFYELRTNSDVSYSVGARATLWERGCLGVGIEAEYFHAAPQGYRAANEYVSGLTFDYREWQVGGGIAYRINIASCATALIPYIAVRGGQTWVDFNNFQFIDEDSNLVTFFDQRQDGSWGYAVGLTLVGCNKIQVTAEGSFVNELAFQLNSNLRF